MFSKILVGNHDLLCGFRAEMLAEAYWVLKPDGCLLIGFIDRERALGRDYMAHLAESVFQASSQKK